jgi:hypothetical protein
MEAACALTRPESTRAAVLQRRRRLFHRQAHAVALARC